MKWIDKLFDFLTKYMPFLERFRVMGKYLFFSVVATIGDIVLLYVLTDFFYVYYLLSSIISYCFGIIINFSGQKRYTFKNKGRTLPQFISFVIISLIGLALNIGILKLLVDVFGVWYIYAKIISIAIVFFWNFIINKTITFSRIK